MKLTIPLRTYSEANKREHWAVKAKRVKSQRMAVWAKWPIVEGERYRTRDKSFTVYLTRIAPRELDGDNLQRSFKALRDEVAKQLGVDDRDKRICWEYHQCKGKPKQYGVEIEILPCPLAPLAGGRE